MFKPNHKNAIRNSFLYFLFLVTISAQPSQNYNSGELKIAVEKFNVLGSVLYLAAHPDDENTALIAYYSKGEKYRTGYLSLTRGDGGQNLIGSEKGAEIGIIRTQELLQARSIDGGEQFFTRAVDFGYSKSEDESLQIWGKDEVLADVVWIIRKYKPDVIITRFAFGESGGHGHHTASSTLAAEAFKAAADPNRFKEQLKYVEPWQAKRIFWNTWRPEKTEGLIKLDVGHFNPLLGKSYLEIAAESRTMHKSQGFGASAFRGSRFEYLQLFRGDSVKENIFEGINTKWSRIEGGEKIEKLSEEVIKKFDSENPAASVPKLIEMYKQLNKLGENYWVEIKRKELTEIIKQCLGLWIEAVADDYSASPGEIVKIKTLLVSRLSGGLKLKNISVPSTDYIKNFDDELLINKRWESELQLGLPSDYQLSQPYWLSGKYNGLFEVNNQEKIGLAENPPALAVKYSLEIENAQIEFTAPVVYRWNDRVDGELYRPFEIRPPVTANVIKNGTIFSDRKPKEIQIKLKNNIAKSEGEIHLHTSKDWKIEPEIIPFNLEGKYSEKTFTIKITPPENSSETFLNVEINLGGKKYNQSIVEIVHPHIKRQTYFPECSIKLIKLDVKKNNDKIGYIMGSGDEIPETLESLGYNVSLLSDELLENIDLNNYDVIISGIRAYNTRERLAFVQQKLMDFVKNGGTYIVQYNTPQDMLVEQTGPYKFKIGRDRITDENSQVKFINPDHQLLNYPNKITQSDFTNWVQERGLYYAENWAAEFEPVISGNDPGEKDLTGGILFSRYGKGVFIYTGLSFFRELPAGIPGAYKLFVNLISAGSYERKE